VDPSKLKTGDIVAAAGGVLLIVSLFLDWYGGASVGGSLPAGLPSGFSDLTQNAPKAPSVDGWDSLGFIDYVLLLTGLVALKQGGIRVAGLRGRLGIPISAVTTGLGGIAMTLVIWRICDPVADGDLKVGIFLALIGSAAVGMGGYLAARADGFDFYEDDN
jgi:hypothetical protein